MSGGKLPRIFLTRFSLPFQEGAQYVYAYRDRKFPEDIEYCQASELDALRADCAAIVERKDRELSRQFQEIMSLKITQENRK